MTSALDGWGIGHVDSSPDRVLKTGDGGNTWREVTPPEAIPAGAEANHALGYFESVDRAWVIYSAAAGSAPASAGVWRTGDGGETWQSSQALDLNGLAETFVASHLQFIDSNTGWLLAHVGVGMNHDYIVIYRSTDGGASWARIIDPIDHDGGVQACQKTAMLFTDGSHGWLTGSCNGVAAGVLLFRTADGGQNWEAVSLPAPAPARDLFTSFEVACGTDFPTFLDVQTGYIGVSCTHFTQDPQTTDHYLYATQDGGNRWTSVAYPGGALFFFDAQTGLALGKETFKTEDSGKSWPIFSVVTWSGQYDFLDRNLAWAVAQAGDQFGLVSSVDGGQTWKLLEPLLIR